MAPPPNLFHHSLFPSPPPPSFLYFPIFHNRPSPHSEDPQTANIRDELEKEASSPLPIGLDLNLESSNLVDSIEKLLSRDDQVRFEECQMCVPSFLQPQHVNNFNVAPRPRVTNKQKLNKTQALIERAEKFKADHLPCDYLSIGCFELRSKYSANLMAKCYYGKRQFVWEILNNGLKRKIEFQWQDILAMRITIQENGPGILMLELSQPPTFAEEIDPKPRQHTRWNTTKDFTIDNQASTYRIHYLEFPPGILDNHYEKLMKDNQMFQLSQKDFPSVASRYFAYNENQPSSSSQPIPPIQQTSTISNSNILPSAIFQHSPYVMGGFQHLTPTFLNQANGDFTNLQAPSNYYDNAEQHNLALNDNNFSHCAQLLMSANWNSNIGFEERHMENSRITHANDTSTSTQNDCVTLQHASQLQARYVASNTNEIDGPLQVFNGNLETQEAMITMGESSGARLDLGPGYPSSQTYITRSIAGAIFPPDATPFTSL